MKINTYYPPRQSNTAFQAKIPERTVTIISKDGKDYISSDFIGYHARRESIVELVFQISSGIESLVQKIFRNVK